MTHVAVPIIQHVPVWMDYINTWILGTNYHYYKRVCRAQWLSKLTYISKVFQPWLCDKNTKMRHIVPCPRYNTYTSIQIFPYFAQMIASIRGCVANNTVSPFPMSSMSFSHDFAIKHLKYDTFFHVHSRAYTVLNGFFPYLAQIITNMKGCFASVYYYRVHYTRTRVV